MAMCHGRCMVVLAALGSSVIGKASVAELGSLPDCDLADAGACALSFRQLRGDYTIPSLQQHAAPKAVLQQQELRQPQKGCNITAQEAVERFVHGFARGLLLADVSVKECIGGNAALQNDLSGLDLSDMKSFSIDGLMKGFLHMAPVLRDVLNVFGSCHAIERAEFRNKEVMAKFTTLVDLIGAPGIDSASLAAQIGQSLGTDILKSRLVRNLATFLYEDYVSKEYMAMGQQMGFMLRKMIVSE
mmetsp:Transcript_182327/g.443814  ORF Transcript_182327/g.443814 Transcript_182327/m.443814 type:complete len:244 (+) Transcript_182327:100-831(+)